MRTEDEMVDVLGRAGLTLFRARLEAGRAIDRRDVEERVACRLADVEAAPDVTVLEHEGLVRLFVRPDGVERWTSGYVWRLALVDELVARALTSAPEAKAA